MIIREKAMKAGIVDRTVKLYQSKSQLHYGPGMRVVAWVDQEISNLYRSLIPKYYYAQAQMYPAHITVARLGKEEPTNMDVWQKYEGKMVEFSYEPIIRSDGIYFYIDVISEEIGDIREELGLKRFRFTDLGADRGHYHITITNLKNQKKASYEDQVVSKMRD